MMSWTHGEPVLAASCSPWAPEGIGPCCPLSGPDVPGRHLLVAGRDAKGEQRIAHVEIDPNGGQRARMHNIVLDQGPPGRFDSNGVGYPFVTSLDDRRILLFVGWLRLAGPAPFRNDIAAALLDDDLKVCDRPAIPLLPPTPKEPFGSGSCCVMDTEKGPRLLYTSFNSWSQSSSGIAPNYELRSVLLNEAGNPERKPDTVIPASRNEYAISHPSTLTTQSGVLCAFTARGDRYRLFGAVSRDGSTWSRLPGQLEVPGGKYDGDMQCYPRLIEDDEGPQLFYSGDVYGRQTLLRARWVGPPLSDVVAATLEEVRAIRQSAG